VPCRQGSESTKTPERRGITVSKKVPVVKFATPQMASEMESLPPSAPVAMAGVAAAMKEELLAFATSAGADG
jgi:hypothetical protein